MKKTLLTLVLLASTSSFANEVICVASTGSKNSEMEMTRTIENTQVLAAQIANYDFSLMLDTSTGDISEATILDTKSKVMVVSNGKVEASVNNPNQAFEVQMINGVSGSVATITCQVK